MAERFTKKEGVQEVTLPDGSRDRVRFELDLSRSQDGKLALHGVSLVRVKEEPQPDEDGSWAVDEPLRKTEDRKV